MSYLAILLLAPWLLILCWAYWAYPKSLPRTAARRWFDGIALLTTAFATMECATLAFTSARIAPVGDFGRASGAIWQQVLPALEGYGACVGVLLVALFVRHLIWHRRA